MQIVRHCPAGPIVWLPSGHQHTGQLSFTRTPLSFILRCFLPSPICTAPSSPGMISNDYTGIRNDLPDCKNQAIFKTIKPILGSTLPFIFKCAFSLYCLAKNTHFQRLFLVIVTVMLFKVYWAGKSHSYLFNLSNLYWILSSHILALGHFP